MLIYDNADPATGETAPAAGVGTSDTISTGAGTETPAGQTATETKPSADPELVAKLTQTIRHDVKNTYAETFEANGLPVVRDDKKRVNWQKTVIDIKAKFDDYEKRITELQSGSLSPEERAKFEAQVEHSKTWKEKAQQLEAELASERQNYQTTLLKNKVQSAFQGKVVDDSALAFAVEGFLKEAEIVSSDEPGQPEYVRWKGEPVLNDKYEYATLSEAAAKWLDTYPFLAPASTRAAVKGSNGVPVGTQVIDARKVMNVNPEDIISGKITVAAQ